MGLIDWLNRPFVSAPVSTPLHSPPVKNSKLDDHVIYDETSHLIGLERSAVELKAEEKALRDKVLGNVVESWKKDPWKWVEEPYRDIFGSSTYPFISHRVSNGLVSILIMYMVNSKPGKPYKYDGTVHLHVANKRSLEVKELDASVLIGAYIKYIYGRNKTITTNKELRSNITILKEIDKKVLHENTPNIGHTP